MRASPLPFCRGESQISSVELTRAAPVGGRAKDVGINVNLAPVTDTVPAEIGRANEPIGKYGRQYGSDPDTVTRASSAFLTGMIEGGVMGTVKHFPGLGRVERNTDFNTTGITDAVATENDPFLARSRRVKAGAGLVWCSAATPGDPAKAGDFRGASPCCLASWRRGVITETSRQGRASARGGLRAPDPAPDRPVAIPKPRDPAPGPRSVGRCRRARARARPTWLRDLVQRRAAVLASRSGWARRALTTPLAPHARTFRARNRVVSD